MQCGLFHVGDGDQADAVIIAIHHDQLFDAVAVQQAAGLVAVDPLAHRDEVVLGHQVGHLLVRVGGKAHVAVGDDADQAAGFFHHRDAGNAVLVLERQDIAEGGVGRNGDGVHHHAGFKALDLPHLVGLGLGCEVAVDDAHAPRLRHGNGQSRLGDGIHGGGNDRHDQFDIAGETGAGIGLAGQHR